MKILILGAGFGGIYTLKGLHKYMHGRAGVEFELVGEKNYFLFTPLLHEVATGGLTPASIVEPIHQVLGCCLRNFYLGRAEKINLKNKTVEIAGNLVAYDQLVIATGAETNFFSVPGADKYAHTLKSIACAVNIKNKILTTMERASHVSDSAIRQKMLRFVVVGGGPTGVELAAEIRELACDTFSKYYPGELVKDVSVMLVHRDKELVPQLSKKMQKKSLAVLRRKGIEIRLESPVKEVGKDFIVLGENERVPTGLVVWTAGVKPALPAFDEEVPRARDGRLLVNKFLQLEGHPEIFVVGDAGAFEQDGQMLPALAQVAEKEARAVAKNIAQIAANRPLRKFKYRHSGTLLSLGQWMAAAEIKGFFFSGRLAWWIWRTVYLFKFISLRKKIRVAVEWTINLFSPRDISEL